MIEAFQRLSLQYSQFYSQISSQNYSQTLLNSPEIKKLDNLRITNFKSFLGTVYVGPLLDFTSIVGPNGAGKSNVLDALMFCFCNQKSKSGYFDIRQYITRQNNESYSEMNDKNIYCQVQTHFILVDNSKLVFARRLYPNQHQTFRINYQEYSQKAYQSYLMKKNINYISSNYAIWQGQVDKLLMKNPKQLTNYMQSLSGSIFFKKDQQTLKNQLKEILQNQQKITVKLVKLKKQKKIMKSFNNQKEAAQKLHQQYQILKKKLSLIKIIQSQRQLSQVQHFIIQKQNSQKSKLKQINQKKSILQKQQAQKIKIKQRIQQITRKIAQLEANKKKNQQITNIIDIQSASQLQKQIQNLQKFRQTMNLKLQNLNQQLLTFNCDVNNQYLQLYNKWENQNQARKQQLTRLKDQYIYSQNILQSKKRIFQEYNQKILKSKSKNEQQKKQKDQISRHIQDIDKNINKINMQLSKLNQQFSQFKQKKIIFQEKIDQLNQKIIHNEQIMYQHIQNIKDKQLLQKLSSIEGFKGMVQQWVQPSSAKYNACFKILMGSLLKYLICVDEQSSKKVALKLKQNFQLKTVILLSNAYQTKQLYTRAILGKSCKPAIDAINFDKNAIHNFDIFLNSYLNGKVICQNLTEAWQIFGQNIRGVKEIYTIDGNVLKNDGVVSAYGAYQNLKQKNNIQGRNKAKLAQQIQNLKKQKLNLEQQLQKLKKKNNDQAFLNLKHQISKLQTHRKQFSDKFETIVKNMKNKSQIKIPSGLQKQILSSEQKIQKTLSQIKKIENEMSKSNIFSEFFKKHNIKGFDNLRNVQDFSSLQQTIKQKTKITKQLKQIDSEILKVQSKINEKKIKINQIKQKFKNFKTQSQLSHIEQKIYENQKLLAQQRSKLNKMSNISLQNLRFISEIPHLQSKLNILKQKHNKLINQISQQFNGPQRFDLSNRSLLQSHFGRGFSNITKQKLDRVYQQLNKQHEKIQQQLDRKNVNVDQYPNRIQNQQQYQKQITQLSQKLRQIQISKTQINTKLQNTKQQRKKLFLDFMNKLKPILEHSYGILTEDRDGERGKVNIFMENQQNPCDYGLYYSPVPPKKKFLFDLDHLSGGQKSIASLALQYSIARASKSSFLLLDQVDAYLDSNNVSKFLKLIQEANRNDNLQCILITHKKSIFLQGNSLVGVTRPSGDPFTKAYSLRLNQNEQ